jgi:ELWxxDGT repeat protein
MLVKEISPGAGSAGPESLTAVNECLFFVADDGIHGRELWTSNGSESGTILVKDIHPGAEAGGPHALTNVAGRLFFVADDGVHGPELWVSDGYGAAMVRDIVPGSSGSMPESLAAVHGVLVFAATDQDGRTALWRSDGTTAGTHKVQEIAPGSPFSYAPADFTVAGNRLFFAADDGYTGLELWSIPLVQGTSPSLSAPSMTSATPGGVAFILIRYGNTGVMPATGLTLSGDLDAALTYVGDTGDPPPAINGNRIEWDLPELGFLEERWLGLQIRVPDVEPGASFPLTLTLSATGEEANPPALTARVDVMVALQTYFPVAGQ